MKQEFRIEITDMLGIEHPILMGGMQWISQAAFAAEVCNAGCTGFITAETFESDQDLRTEIRKMRTLTDKPIGISISMLPEIGDLQDRTLTARGKSACWRLFKTFRNFEMQGRRNPEE